MVSGFQYLLFFKYAIVVDHIKKTHVVAQWYRDLHPTWERVRQLCIDRMTFNADGTIQKIVPTHDGIGALALSVVKSENLAFGKSVCASSFYDDNFRPEYAVDDNNGTLWRLRGMGQEWIEIDLGRVQQIQTHLDAV